MSFKPEKIFCSRLKNIEYACAYVHVHSIKKVRITKSVSAKPVCVYPSRGICSVSP